MRPQTRPLTALQKAVMAVIRSWLTEHGHGPTVREIGTRVGLSSTSSVVSRKRSRYLALSTRGEQSQGNHLC
ncbi:hypothetical protein ACIPMU_35640 [Streptomyces cyaneofuscatus]|uniref:LexA family protein n=1 Tax=Streptomyces cyaneofuscatus TaxID=66883 RepID=UPI00382BA695